MNTSIPITMAKDIDMPEVVNHSHLQAHMNLSTTGIVLTAPNCMQSEIGVH